MNSTREKIAAALNRIDRVLGPTILDLDALEAIVREARVSAFEECAAAAESWRTHNKHLKRHGRAATAADIRNEIRALAAKYGPGGEGK